MISITAFSSRFDNKGSSFEKTWEHIAAKLNKARVVSEKGDAPLISPVVYADNLEGFKETKRYTNKKGKEFIEWINNKLEKRITDGNKNLLRNNSNVKYITMLVFDFDSGMADPEAISKPWAKYNHVIHSTWSHTKERGKYRLILPLGNPIKPEDFKWIWADIVQIAGEVDASCKDPARMFYWPSHKPGNEDIHYFKAVTNLKDFQPKIKKPAAKKIKRGDYNTLDAVGWFSAHDHYIGSANKQGQHWVKCPWENEHQSKTEKVDAVLWESTGDNWPTFQCSHSTCKMNERNIVQVTKFWTDADNFAAVELKKSNIQSKNNIKCLGHDDNGYYYYQSTKNNHVVKLKPESHKELNFYDITPDGDYWFKGWGKEENGRVDWKQAARQLMEDCQNAGFFKPLSVRGAGCWSDEHRIVTHLGDKLRISGEDIALTELKSDYIYESAVQPVAYKTPLNKAEAFKLCEIINMLPIPNEVERFLLSGHCVASLLSGCLRWRPHVWITGDSGSGKTTIVNDVLNKLWAPVGGMFMEGRTTESGVRQKVKHNAVPVIIDEVEANSKDEAIRVDSLVAMARSSSSNSSGNVAKGTISGSGLSFLVKTCFTFSSIAEALQWNQDKERFLVVSVIGSERSRENWPELRTMIEKTISKDFSLRFFSRVTEMSGVILENCDVFSRVILKRFKKASSRNADQVSVHAACAWSLRSDDVITEEQANQIIDSHGGDKAWSRFWSSEETNTAYAVLDKILSKHLRGDNGRNFSVGELVSKIKDPDPMDSFRGSDENIVLQRYGMLVQDGYFWVSKINQELAAILKSDGGYGQMLNYLKNMADVKLQVKTFSGLQNPAIGIPLDIVFRKR